MDEVGQAAPAPQRAGDRLRAARERAGLSIADIAERTRVTKRHLEAVEQSDYAALPSHTYATGFAKAFARAVGEDEVAIARQVRDEIDRGGGARRAPEYQPYQPPDPARVPSRGLVVVALGLALAVAVLTGLWFLSDVFRGGGTAGTTVVAAPPVAGPAPVVAARPTPTPAGRVVLTARDAVWLRVYDAANATLYIGTLAPGATFEVPAGANRPLLNVGRPDQLAITIDGAGIPPLGDGRRPLKDVPLDAASLRARAAGTPAPAATVAARPAPTPRAAPSVTAAEAPPAILVAGPTPAASATPQP